MKRKTDYFALQTHWNCIINLYIYTQDKGFRIDIIDDLKDFLIDINTGDKSNEEEFNKKQIRSNYFKWEREDWEPMIKAALKEYIKVNPEDFVTTEDIVNKEEKIKQDLNHLRIRKIIQLIQDSGIGLGGGKVRGQYELQGFMGE